MRAPSALFLFLLVGSACCDADVCSRIISERQSAHRLSLEPNISEVHCRALRLQESGINIKHDTMVLHMTLVAIGNIVAFSNMILVACLTNVFIIAIIMVFKGTSCKDTKKLLERRDVYRLV